MRIVLDTNVLIVSIPKQTAYYPIFQAFEDGAIELCVTTDILNEYVEKLQEKFSPSVASNTMKAIEKSPDTVFIEKYFFWNLITADPDDNKFVDCAVAANADFIVTNDRHFKVLIKIPFPKVKVISADEFLSILKKV
jgi:putative PIN family toxin of toxin-antitoxin system